MPIRVAMNWMKESSLQVLDSTIPVRQVYVWLITSDKKILIVSKDGIDWQLPGGKPEADESQTQTAVRELYEETGVDVAAERQGLVFFGYNDVIKVEEDSSESRFLQLRFYLELGVPSWQLQFSVEGEDQQQKTEDQIMHVRAVGITQAKQLIPWLEASGEYRTIASMHILD